MKDTIFDRCRYNKNYKKLYVVSVSQISTVNVYYISTRFLLLTEKKSIRINN